MQFSATKQNVSSMTSMGRKESTRRERCLTSTAVALRQTSLQKTSSESSLVVETVRVEGVALWVEGCGFVKLK